MRKKKKKEKKNGTTIGPPAQIEIRKAIFS